MTATRTLSQRWDAVMMPNYGTPPIVIDHGQGVRVWDDQGRSYLDFVGGIAVTSLGHAHPAVVAAVRDQITKLAHSSNLAIHEPGVTLAERLVALLGLPGRVFFANSGAEANECALKLARKHRAGGDIVACDGSFHGRTMGALSITGNPAKRAPFEPLPGPVSFVPFGDMHALRKVVTDRTAAVFVEPALGEGGVVPAPPGYLGALRELCDVTGALLVIDEVQTGIGRTGQWFACQGEGVRPDVITLAKGLGGGLPIGACIGIGPAGGLFAAGDHGSTFGGNPVSCAAALAVLDTLSADDVLGNVKRVGEYLGAALESIDAPLVAGTRGSGLWRAITLVDAKAAAVEAAARNRGLLVNAVRPEVIRLAPPLILTENEVDEAALLLRAALEDVS
jgi:acetylornithine/N-succinyldiaminopimelate aminotransferase